MKSAVDANREPNLMSKILPVASASRPEPVERATTTANPYRFWLNDDDDGNALNDEQEISGGTAKDYESRGDFGIASKRDLEDFARLWLSVQGLTAALKSGDLQLGFKWTDGYTGTPKINLYLHYEADGGTKYLTDSPTAAGQTTYPWSATLVSTTNKNVVAPGDVFVLKKGAFDNLTEEQPTAHFLFEGAGEGKGRLQIVLLDKNGSPLGEGPGVWMDLASVKSMYQGPGTTFRQPADETPQGIVFVHGWNMSPEGSRNFAETMFKRLWHLGFKGRFVSLRWNTNYSDAFDHVPVIGAAVEGYLADYNGSERVAWQSGAALKAAVDGLPAGYSRNLVAHSMGNIVAGSALLAGLTVNNYVLLQAAVPASSYDDRELLKQAERPSPHTYAGFRPDFWEADVSPDDDPVPETRALSYRGRLSASVGNLVSFYLPDDHATTYAWEFNNDQTKPMNGYGYTRGAPVVLGSQRAIWRQIGTGPSAVQDSLTDPFVAMPFVCRSWSKAAGADSRTAGVIQGSLDLSLETFSLPGSTGGFRDEHSAQFDRSIQVLKPFYDELLNRFDIDPTP